MVEFKKKKIIVTDDSQTFIMYLAILLKRMGFEVMPAENGTELLKLLKKTGPDLIFLDINMPVMDGFTLLEHIKSDKHFCTIPVVMVSVDASSASRAKCKELGCDGFLAKPLQLNKLNEVLQDCIFSPIGIMRKYIRTSFNRKVTVVHHGKVYNLYSEALSERGMYIRKPEPFPVGSEISIILPLEGDEKLELKGTVIYIKGLFGDVFRISPGMGIEFTGLDSETSDKIRALVIKQLAGDIIDSQEENIIDSRTFLNDLE